jgi:LPS export ABC transporter protein LptC
MIRNHVLWVAVWGWAFALTACGEETTRPVAGDDLTAIDANSVQYDMRSIFTAEGVRTGYVTADSAFIYADTGSVARMYKVNITFENERGIEQATVVADSGSLNQQTEKMDAWGNVVVTLGGRGCRITSSEIHYDPPAQQIYTNQPVRFEQSGQVATGSGFTSDLQMNNFSIRNPVGPFSICSESQGEMQQSMQFQLQPLAPQPPPGP